MALLVLASSAYVGGVFGLYYYADILYSSIVASNIDSRTQLESILKYTKSSPIDMNDSKWGNHIVLETNQICIQYRVLGFHNYPIDVIFENNTNVVKVLSSYE